MIVRTTLNPKTLFHSFSLYQLLIPAFALLMIGRSYSKWRHRQRTLRELSAVVATWGFLAAFSLVPDFFLSRISSVTGIQNGVYAIIFFALVVLLYAVFSLFMKIEHLERDITDLVRREALDDHHLKQQ